MNWLSTRKTAKLHERRRKKSAHYARVLRKAVKDSKSKEELDAIQREALFEDQLADDETQGHITFSLLRRANQLSVRTPSRDDEALWRGSPVNENIRYLNTEGIAALTESIRLEEQKRRDERSAHLESTGKIVVLLTGFAGTVIGLIAIMKK